MYDLPTQDNNFGIQIGNKTNERQVCIIICYIGK